jgi:D-alanine-D-alanine ligase
MAVVGVMYNLKGDPPEEGEPPDLGAELDSESTVLAVASALKAYGHDVCLIEGNDTALMELRARSLDIVFNMCEGIRGESRESHIPAVLEMLGIPYTGSGVLSLSVTLDKPMTKKVLAYHGIPTAKFRVFTSESDIDLEDLDYPVFVKPSHEGSSMGVSPSSFCAKPLELHREARRLLKAYGQPVLVEEFLPGREFTVGIIGNKNPHVFPIMEINFDLIPESHGMLYSRQFKTDWSEEVYYSCPASMPLELEEAVRDIALRTFRVLECRDLSRVDIRLDKNGVPNVMEVNPLPGLIPGFSDYPRIAEKDGWSYEELINGVLGCALGRYNLFHLLPARFCRQIA